jgi:DNA-binding NtrC family response regulator
LETKGVEMKTLKTLNEVMREYIYFILEKCKGNRTKAAEILGIGIRTVRRYANGHVPSKGQKSEQYLKQLEKENPTRREDKLVGS